MPSASNQCPPVASTVPAPALWSIYLVLCTGNVIYTGITNNVTRRYQQHCAGNGAKFTRSRPPLQLLCHAVAGDKSTALKLEYAVKQLPRSCKVSFVQSFRMEDSRAGC